MRLARNRMKNKFLIALFIIGTAVNALAQQSYQYMSQLPTPKTSDFHVIDLNEHILAHSNADLSDIRLMDAKGKIVPYIFGNDLPAGGIQQFVVFKHIVTEKKDTATTFVVEKDLHVTAISQLLLKLRNTAVERTADFAGSDDLKNWYAITENIVLQKAEESAGAAGVYEQLLSFPSSNFKYFRIRINNKRRDPVAILQAGIYGLQRVDKPVYKSLQDLRFRQKDSGAVSYVYVKQGDDYPVNELHLIIAGSKYYKRGIRVYEAQGRYRNLLKESSISSGSDNVFRFSAKTRAFELEIDNGDNPPLAVTGVAASMLAQSLIAYLDKSSNYRLVFGDSTAITPSYDLKFFTDSLERKMPHLSPGKVQSNGPYLPKHEAAAKTIPAWIIWLAIGAVLALLIYLTVKMTGEVKKREK